VKATPITAAPVSATLVRLAILALVGCTLAGCGKRADPTLDPGKENRFPRTYPAPSP
jgi:hypothetical protein